MWRRRGGRGALQDGEVQADRPQLRGGIHGEHVGSGVREAAYSSWGVRGGSSCGVQVRLFAIVSYILHTAQGPL